MSGMVGSCTAAAPASFAAARSSAGLSDSVLSGRDGPVLCTSSPMNCLHNDQMPVSVLSNIYAWTKTWLKDHCQVFPFS